jgi:hypothetical protein
MVKNILLLLDPVSFDEGLASSGIRQGKTALKCRMSTANIAEFFSGRLFGRGSLPGPNMPLTSRLADCIHLVKDSFI